MELKKSYKGLVLWMLGYLVLCFGPIPFLPDEMDVGLVTRYFMNITTLDMALLAWIILKKEAVYWYNGTEFEEAVKAGSERRKEFARKHFRVFFRFALLYLVFTLLMVLLNAPFWIDIVVGTIGLIAAAVSTIRFKL